MKDDAVTPQTFAATVLIVDDDTVILSGLRHSLERRGYRVLTANDVPEMERVLGVNPVDLVVLDIMMPGEDGLSACRRLAANGGPPVIILSALGEEEDRITGLEIGADHYLSKPCSPREVVAHVRTLLRRHHNKEAPRKVLFFHRWRIDLDANEVFDNDGVLVHLTDGEFALLRVFVERPRRVLTRDQLLHGARGADSEAFDRAIDIQISRLRRKLKAPGDSLIRTIRNEGYMLTAKVSLSAIPT